MKVSPPKTEISTGSAIKSRGYSMTNKAMMQSVMRDKIYSNGFKACMQEIMSNARDANREVGNGDVPIEVIFPSGFDGNPCVTIKDCGPGIDPGRNQIMCGYFDSTKRDDDTLTGGWGLGSKTPFAIGDSFHVWTVYKFEAHKYLDMFNEDRELYDDLFSDCNDGFYYEDLYHHFIDAKNESSVMRVSHKRVSDRGTTGSEIRIPTDNVSLLLTWVKFTGQWWDIKPKVRNISDFEWPEVKVFLKEGNKKWFRYYRKEGNTGCIAIIDGIEYPISISSFSGRGYEDSFMGMLKQPFALEFGIGEVAVTPTREDLDYESEDTVSGDPTIKILERKINGLLGSYKEDIQKELDTITNFKEAVGLLGKKWVIGSTKGLTWNGINLKKIKIEAQYRSKPFHLFQSDDPYTEKPESKPIDQFSVSPDYGYLINDLNKNSPSPGRVATAMQILGVNKIVVVSQEDHVEGYGRASELSDELSEYWIESIRAYDTTVFKSGTPAKQVVKIKRIAKHRTINLNPVFHDTDRRLDCKRGGIYVPIKGRKVIGNLRTHSSSLPKIYGVLERHVKDLSDSWISLEDWAFNKLTKLIAAENNEIVYQWESWTDENNILKVLNILSKELNPEFGMISKLKQLTDSGRIIQKKENKDEKSSEKKIDRIFDLVPEVKHRIAFEKKYITFSIDEMIEENYPLFTFSKYKKSVGDDRTRRFLIEHVKKVDRQRKNPDIFKIINKMKDVN